MPWAFRALLRCMLSKHTLHGRVVLGHDTSQICSCYGAFRRLVHAEEAANLYETLRCARRGSVWLRDVNSARGRRGIVANALLTTHAGGLRPPNSPPPPPTRIGPHVHSRRPLWRGDEVDTNSRGHCRGALGPLCRAEPPMRIRRAAGRRLRARRSSKAIGPERRGRAGQDARAFSPSRPLRAFASFTPLLPAPPLPRDPSGRGPRPARTGVTLPWIGDTFPAAISITFLRFASARIAPRGRPSPKPVWLPCRGRGGAGDRGQRGGTFPCRLRRRPGRCS